MINPYHIKASDPNKHPGLEVGQQAVRRAAEEQDKGVPVSKPALMETQLKCLYPNLVD